MGKLCVSLLTSIQIGDTVAIFAYFVIFSSILKGLFLHFFHIFFGFHLSHNSNDCDKVARDLSNQRILTSYTHTHTLFTFARNYPYASLSFCFCTDLVSFSLVCFQNKHMIWMLMEQMCNGNINRSTHSNNNKNNIVIKMRLRQCGNYL